MLRFPRLDILRLAICREAVPPEVRRAPADAGFDEQSGIWLDPRTPLSGGVHSELRLLGVDIEANGTPPPMRSILCWHQLFDLVECPASAVIPSRETPVLFDLPDWAAWSCLVAEMRRLAPENCSLGWRETDDRILLRICGPPLYSLLRALERDGLPGKPTAFVEQSPRVWVELGWRHPVAADIEVPSGQMLFIRRPRAWSFLGDAPCEQELVELPLPDISPQALDAPAAIRLPVSLRLTRANHIDAAELWVMRERPFEQLAELLRDADDGLLASLAIAALADAEEPVVVLRSRSGKHVPPVLVLQAESYRSYLKLPNLYVPVGHRLRPPLRRDAVRDLLAGDVRQLTWLAMRSGGTFVPERVPETVFAPLIDLVEYLQKEPARHLKPWIQSSQFELAPFLPRDEDVPADWREQFRKPPVPATADAPAHAGLLDRIGRWFRNAVSGMPRLLSRAVNVHGDNEALPATASPGQPPGQQERDDAVAAAVHKFLQPARAAQTNPVFATAATGGSHRSVEDRFLQIAGPLDAPQRVALWPKLAGFYQAEKKWADAALCWMNALWEVESYSPLWLWGWFHSEAHAAHWNEEQPAWEFERCLVASVPDVVDVRAVAAYTAWGVNQQPPVTHLLSRLAEVSQYLEANEHFLPIRGAWLARESLSRLAGGDSLTLARVRDRLLERLFRSGVNLDQDLPGFLRYAGQGGTVRFEPVRDWLVRQREPIHHWIGAQHESQGPDPSQQVGNVLTTARLLGRHPPYGPAEEAYCTRGYADLTLAWGLARLGAASEATQFWKHARTILATRDRVHGFLLEAYSHRIELILDGRPTDGPLPQALLEELNQMQGEYRYKIDWLRQESRILEPSERIDPYRGDVQREYFDSLNPVLARLPGIVDRRELKQRIEQLLATAPDTAQSALPRILKAALDQAPRIDESFAIDLLGRVSTALEEMPAAVEAAPLLEKALFVAAHFEQTVYVQQFLGRFQHLLDRRHGPQAARAFASLAEQSFRGLRKLGMRDEIDRLLKQMADALLQGQSLPNLRVRMGVNIAGVLPTLLQVAGVWFYEGNEADAMAVLDEVRSLLFSNRLPQADQANLAKAYATSLGQAPAAVALDRLEELFRKLDRVNDAMTTRSHFSLAQLGVIEAVVRAVVDANFTLGTTVRRWLDEDEYLMRRRIHRDLKAVMGQTI